MNRRISNPRETVAFVFMKVGCEYCKLAQELLENHGYIVKMIDHRIPKNMNTLLEYLPPEKSRKYITYPQIFIGDRHIDGYSELRRLINSNR